MISPTRIFQFFEQMNEKEFNNKPIAPTQSMAVPKFVRVLLATLVPSREMNMGPTATLNARIIVYTTDIITNTLCQLFFLLTIFPFR